LKVGHLRTQNQCVQYFKTIYNDSKLNQNCRRSDTSGLRTSSFNIKNQYLTQNEYFQNIGCNKQEYTNLKWIGGHDKRLGQGVRRKTVVMDVRRGVGQSAIVRGTIGSRRGWVGEGVSCLRVCAAAGSIVLGCARQQDRSHDDGGVARTGRRDRVDRLFWRDRGRSIVRYDSRSGRR